MKPPPNPLNEDQKAEFDLYVMAWADRLGLHDWRFVRGRKTTPNMAEVSIDHRARLATYRTGNFGSEPITSDSLESTALHEVLHVLLAEVKHGSAYGIEGKALDSAEHRVVHVLERLLMEPKRR